MTFIKNRYRNNNRIFTPENANKLAQEQKKSSRWPSWQKVICVYIKNHFPFCMRSKLLLLHKKHAVYELEWLGRKISIIFRTFQVDLLNVFKHQPFKVQTPK